MWEASEWFSARCNWAHALLLHSSTQDICCICLLSEPHLQEQVWAHSASSVRPPSAVDITSGHTLAAPRAQFDFDWGEMLICSKAVRMWCCNNRRKSDLQASWNSDKHENKAQATEKKERKFLFSLSHWLLGLSIKSEYIMDYQYQITFTAYRTRLQVEAGHMHR